MDELGLPRRALIRTLAAASRHLDAAAQSLQLLAGALLPWPTIERGITRSWEAFGETPMEVPALMGWEEELYGRFLRPRSHLLIVGCGSGRDLLGLAHLGHTLEGLDITPRALETARRRLDAAGIDTPLHLGSVTALTLPARFDAVVFSWYAYSYIQGRHRRHEALRRSAACLRPGGRILLSYITGIPRPRRAWLLARRVARLARTGWTMEEGDLLTAAVRGGQLVIHFEHRFSGERLEDELTATGLRLTHHASEPHGVAVLELAPPRSGP